MTKRELEWLEQLSDIHLRRLRSYATVDSLLRDSLLHNPPVDREGVLSRVEATVLPSGISIDAPGHHVQVVRSISATGIEYGWICSCSIVGIPWPTIRAAINSGMAHAGMDPPSPTDQQPDPLADIILDPDGVAPSHFAPGLPQDGTHRCIRCGWGRLNRTDQVCWKCGSSSIEEV